jgi:hypothetical protein
MYYNILFAWNRLRKLEQKRMWWPQMLEGIMWFNTCYNILFPWNRLRKWEEKRTWYPEMLEGTLQENQDMQSKAES